MARHDHNARQPAPARNRKSIEAKVRDHLMKTCGIEKEKAAAFAKQYLAEIRRYARNTKLLNEALAWLNAGKVRAARSHRPKHPSA